MPSDFEIRIFYHDDSVSVDPDDSDGSASGKARMASYVLTARDGATSLKRLNDSMLSAPHSSPSSPTSVFQLSFTSPTTERHDKEGTQSVTSLNKADEDAYHGIGNRLYDISVQLEALNKHDPKQSRPDCDCCGHAVKAIMKNFKSITLNSNFAMTGLTVYNLTKHFQTRAEQGTAKSELVDEAIGYKADRNLLTPFGWDEEKATDRDKAFLDKYQNLVLESCVLNSQDKSPPEQKLSQASESGLTSDGHLTPRREGGYEDDDG